LQVFARGAHTPRSHCFRGKHEVTTKRSFVGLIDHGFLGILATLLVLFISERANGSAVAKDDLGGHSMHNYVCEAGGRS
jgi:hypothetical protein